MATMTMTPSQSTRGVTVPTRAVLAHIERMRNGAWETAYAVVRNLPGVDPFRAGRAVEDATRWGGSFASSLASNTTALNYLGWHYPEEARRFLDAAHAASIMDEVYFSARKMYMSA